MNAREQILEEIAAIFVKMSSERQKQFGGIISMIVKYPKFSEELQSAIQECESSRAFEVAQELVRKWREKVA